MSDELPTLDRPGLRRFGLIFAALVAGLFGIVVPWVFGLGMPVWPWILAAVFVAWSLIAPGTMGWFYRLWMRFGLLMNAVMSRVILGLVFYLTVLPTGLILRLKGKDPMRRKLDRNSSSYRIESESRDHSHMRKPF